MNPMDTLRKKLSEARKERSALETALRLEKEELKKQSDVIEELKRNLDQNSSGQLKNAETKYQQQLEAWRQKSKALDQLADGVRVLEEQMSGNSSVSEQISAWSDSETITLFPVRLECRFLPIDATVKTRLCIRIFPDDIHIDTHEPLLTENEYSLLNSFWTSVWKGAGAEDVRKSAWRVLCSAIGRERAAYLVQKFPPLNSGDQPTTPVSENEVLTVIPQFEEMQFRSASWSRPPVAKALPDRFVFMGWHKGKKVFEETGKTIPDVLPVGIDPAPLDESDLIRRDGKDLHIPKGMNWLTDFNKAVAVGMGITIDISKLPSEIQSEGFDRIVALGICASVDTGEGQQLLEDLFEAHHYSPEGLSFVPQGMATNNTGDIESGYSSFDLAEESSYSVEASGELFTETEDWKQKKDGQIFSEWMGIDVEALQHLQYSNESDQRDARAMNMALWPGTLGYYLEEMMDPFFSQSDIRHTKDFFVDHVTARGKIPAIRKGTQPYGILPVTAFSRFRFTAEQDKTRASWNSKLLSLLKMLDSTWTELAKEKVSYAGKAGDPYAILLDILGLHPNSVEFYQRYSVGENYMTSLLNFEGLGRVAVLWHQNRKKDAEDLLKELGYPEDALPVIATFSWFNSAVLLNGPVVDTVPVSETELLTGSSDRKNYLQWLLDSNLDTIRDEDFGEATKPQSLLYLYLRNAYLQSVWDGSSNILDPDRTSSRAEAELLYIGKENTSKGKWETMYSPHAATTGSSGKSIGQYLSSVTDFTGLGNSANNLENLREGIELLADRPTAHLERAFAEHLDLCSYRLDTWWWGLANKRLEEIRYGSSKSGNSKSLHKGTYIGGYGYLENLKPDQRTLEKKNAADIHEDFHVTTRNPIYTDPQNGGFLFTPSSQHAITAAVLRNAYLTNTEESDPDKYAIDLSSSRVRKALVLIEGVRNGQELGELLGYQLERGLHDRYSEKEMDTWIYELRESFPLYKDQVQGDGVTHSSSAELARTVINGLAVIEHIRKSAIADYPWGKELSSSDSTANRIIDEEVAKMQDMLDAMGDLMMAESVHQAVKGNYERSTAALRSISESTLPPQPEFIQSPASGFSITNRVALQVKARVAGETLTNNAAYNPYYSRIPFTARAQAAFGLNQWLASVLPDPGTVKCLSRYSEIESETVTWEQLDLQPIDLLYIFDVEPESFKGELDARVQTFIRSTIASATEATITTDYSERGSDWSATDLTFFELTPLLISLRKLVISAKFLSASDLYLPSEAGEDGIGTGVDLIELEERVSEHRLKLSNLKDALDTALTPFAADTVPVQAEFDAVRSILLNIAEYGIENSFPSSTVGADQAAQEKLFTQSKALSSKISSLLAEYDALILFDADAGETTKTEAWINASAKLFGKGFRVIPGFTLGNATEITNSAARDFTAFLSESDSPLPLDDWMFGLARVRTRMEAAEHVELFSAQFATTGWNWKPLQLPYVADDRWLAQKLPDDYTPTGDALLATIHHAAPFDPAALQCGLLLDEWVETIPSPAQNAGLAFHFDAPNSEPPNTILLAVTPEITGNWKWDDLVDSVLETMEMAKKRAVEPTQIDTGALAQFLPALTMAVTRLSTTVSTNLLQNISTDAVLNTKIS